MARLGESDWRTVERFTKKWLYDKFYYDTHRESALATGRVYYREHQDEKVAYQRHYRIAHPDLVSARVDKWKQEHPESVKQITARYRKTHTEQRRAYSERYEQEHKADIAARKKARRLARRDAVNEYQRQWRINHPTQSKQYQVAYYGKNALTISHQKAYRKSTDPNYHLSLTLRGRLYMWVKSTGKSKPCGTMQLVGCPIDYLRLRLECQFRPGMTWQNFGRGGWEIDHIIPLSMFNLADIDQAKAACHYSNLQPLWARDNRSKGAKLDWKEEAA